MWCRCLSVRRFVCVQKQSPYQDKKKWILFVKLQLLIVFTTYDDRSDIPFASQSFFLNINLTITEKKLMNLLVVDCMYCNPFWFTFLLSIIFLYFILYLIWWIDMLHGLPVRTYCLCLVLNWSIGCEMKYLLWSIMIN